MKTTRRSIKTVLIPIWLLSLPPTEGAAPNKPPEKAETQPSHPPQEAKPGIDLRQLEASLKSGGLDGWIHGAVNDQGLYVFTYRNPRDFFLSAEFPLITRSAEVERKLRRLRRHDRVRVRGEFLANPAPVPHIHLSDIKVLKIWEGNASSRRYTEYAAVPDEVIRKNELVGRVHAVGEKGRMLVIDCGDRTFPVFIDDPTLTKGLYRGDQIRLRYVVQSQPGRPVHLRPDPGVSEPIAVLSRIVSGHGKTVTLEGTLVRYPKSPQIRFDIYAIQVKDPEGSKLDYTLVHFTDPKVFESIRKKLGQVWEKSRRTAKAGRNQQVNPKLHVRAKGVLNVQSPQQANPQLILETEADVEITRLP